MTGSDRCRGDRGQIGGIEVLPFGFLFFVAVVLLFVNAWGVVDAKLAVTSSAREAVRAFVEAPDEDSAFAAAQRQAVDTLEAYGRSGDRATVSRPVLEGDGDFERCVRVSVTVAYEVPVIRLPWIGGLGDLRPVTATHSEIVDPFRDDLAGEAAC